MLRTLRMILAGRLAGAEAGDEAAVLLEVVRNLHRVKLDGGVEVAEGDDEQEVEHRVEHGVRVEEVGHNPGIAPAGDEGADGRGQRSYGLCEDYRHDAGHVDLHRQVRALAAVELAPDDALGVLHGDPALCVVHYDYQYDDSESAYEQQDERPPGQGTVADVA